MKSINVIELALFAAALLLFSSHLGFGDTKLDNAIEQFAKNKLTVESPGSYWQYNHEGVDTVLSYGDRAIPALKDALKSPSPLVVAQSAYCLDKLKAKDAVPEVWIAYRRCAAVHKPLKAEDEYALQMTAIFLWHYGGVKDLDSLL